MNAYIKALENKRWLWRGVEQASEREGNASGYPALDQRLSGGFPPASVIEIKTLNGIGELRVLMPYLQQQQQKLMIFIGAPAMLNSEFLVKHSIVLSQVLFVDAQDAEALWCAEQCLKSGCVSCVLLWQQALELLHIRRLVLAAERGESNLFVFRQNHSLTMNLPVALSMELSPSVRGVAVTIHKRRAGRSHAKFDVDMSEYWPDLVKQPISNNVVSLSAHLQKVTQVS